MEMKLLSFCAHGHARNHAGRIGASWLTCVLFSAASSPHQLAAPWKARSRSPVWPTLRRVSLRECGESPRAQTRPPGCSQIFLPAGRAPLVSEFLFPASHSSTTECDAARRFAGLLKHQIHFTSAVEPGTFSHGSNRPPRHPCRNSSVRPSKSRLFSGRAKPCPSSE